MRAERLDLREQRSGPDAEVVLGRRAVHVDVVEETRVHRELDVAAPEGVAELSRLLVRQHQVADGLQDRLLADQRTAQDHGDLRHVHLVLRRERLHVHARHRVAMQEDLRAQLAVTDERDGTGRLRRITQSLTPVGREEREHAYVTAGVRLQDLANLECLRHAVYLVYDVVDLCTTPPRKSYADITSQQRYITIHRNAYFVNNKDLTVSEVLYNIFVIFLLQLPNLYETAPSMLSFSLQYLIPSHLYVLLNNVDTFSQELLAMSQLQKQYRNHNTLLISYSP